MHGDSAGIDYKSLYTFYRGAVTVASLHDILGEQFGRVPLAPIDDSPLGMVSAGFSRQGAAPDDGDVQAGVSKLQAVTLPAIPQPITSTSVSISSSI